MIVRRVLLFLSIFLLSQIASAYSLDVSALSPEQKARLLTQFPNATQSLSLAEMDQIVSHLYLWKQFDAVAVYRYPNTGTYVLEVVTTRKISELRFLGLDQFSEVEAQKILDINTGEKFDQNQLAEAGDRLSQAYADKGYLGTEITFAFPTLKDGSVALDVEVNEGTITKISDIKIETPNNDLNNALNTRLKKHRGKPLTEKTFAEINQDARIFFNTNGYHRAELSGPAIKLNSERTSAGLVYEIPNVEKYTFQFVGNKDFSGFKLKYHLDLKKYFTLTPNVASDLATKLRTFYLDNGYARINVVGMEEAGSAPFSRVVVLTIDEGPKIRIEKINISGRFSRKESYYADFIKEHSTPIIEKGFYNREGLDVGYKNLVTELQNQGFLKAKIISARNQFSDDRSKVTLNVNLDEGSLTEVKEVLFEGNEVYSTSRLSDVINLKAGDPLRLADLENKIKELKNFYLENGFLEMVLLNEHENLVSYNDSNTQATLLFKIREGPQVRVAAIRIEGNAITKDYVIYKEIEFKVGDILTPSKITESINRLQKLGHFSSVEIRTQEEGTNVSERTILIRLSERQPGIFNFGAGIANEISQVTSGDGSKSGSGLILRGYTGLGYRNLGGTGRGISTRGELNYSINQDYQHPDTKLTAGYLEPYLWDTRIRGRVGLLRSDVVTDPDSTRTTTTTQATFSLEQDVTSNILVVWDVWGIADINDYFLSKSKQGTKDPGDLTLGTTSPYVDFDFRDHPFFPTRGTLTRVGTEYSSPDLGSTRGIGYLKSTASFTHYSSWGWPGWVLANSVRGGVLEDRSSKGSPGVPYDKKGFFLGGGSTLRGFDATKESLPIDSELGEDFHLKTRADYYLLKTELRFPIHDVLSGAVFYDGGEVKIKGKELPYGYRSSIGFGLRLNLVVPVVFDIGFKIGPVNKDEREETPYSFSFSIGTF